MYPVVTFRPARNPAKCRCAPDPRTGRRPSTRTWWRRPICTWCHGSVTAADALERLGQLRFPFAKEAR